MNSDTSRQMRSDSRKVTEFNELPSDFIPTYEENVTYGSKFAMSSFDCAVVADEEATHMKREPIDPDGTKGQLYALIEMLVLFEQT